jgi:hypothetical protein
MCPCSQYQTGDVGMGSISKGKVLGVKAEVSVKSGNAVK